MADLSGKTALITGAASGIGAGLAEAFAGAGADLALLDIEQQPLEALGEKLAARGTNVASFVVDVTDRDAMKKTAAEVARRFEGLHILCNNAGVGYAGVALDKVPDHDWDWVVGVNLMGVINGLQAFLPLILARGADGYVVNTASIGGHHVMPGWGHGVYATTKFAVVGLSEALADDLADRGIGVSVLCPAAVDTRIYEAGRNRPARFGGPYAPPADHALPGLLKQGMAPIEVGRWVLRAMRDRQFYIFPHPQTRELIDRRHARMTAAYDWAERVAPEIAAMESAS